MTDQTIDPNYRVDWYRTKVDRDVLAALNERSDVKGFMQAGGFLLLLISTGTLAWVVWKNLHWGWLIPALLLHGSMSVFSINAMHELVHGTVFKTKKLNSFFAALFSFHYWQNHHAFWASHSEHHKFTLHDPHDQEVIVPMEFSLKGFLRTLTLDFVAMKWVLQMNITLARGKYASSWGRYLYGGDARRFTVFNFSRFILAGHATIFAVSIWQGWWLLPVLTSLTPLYGRALQFLLNESQHIGLQDHVDDFRLNSRTFKRNPFLRFVYWHMNWHIEHHMFAGVPCYNLKKLHKEVNHELPYVWKNVAEMWFHIITCLYRQKHEPGYVYIPVLPGGDKPEEVNATKVERTRAGGSDEAVASQLPELGPDGKPWLLWECTVCGFVYDERRGLPEENIAPGTRWEDIPDDWRCPDCGVAKADFDMVELKRGQGEAVASTFDVAAENDAIVIVGSGLAAMNLAREYRKLNRRREVILLTEDDGTPYSKPSLSNALAEGRSPDDLAMKSREALEEELDLTITANCVVHSIDREAKTLSTSTGEIAYGKLVLAVGAEAIKLELAGDATDQVFSVNNLTDYRRWRQALQPGCTVAILGAGLVGCEFANDLQHAGYKVTVIDPENTPLPRLAPPEIGTGLQEALSDIGVYWKLGAAAESVTQSGDKIRIALNTGEEVEADLVLSAVGIRPRTELAQSAGLDVGRGIHVDACMRSSDHEIFALGDCAEINGRVRPYVLPIMHAAHAIARSLAGEATETNWPVMPVAVKTPAFPLLLVPADTDGAWTVEGAQPNFAARFTSANGTLQGFALTGRETQQKKSYLEEMQ